MKVVIIDTGVETTHDVLKHCGAINGLSVIQKEGNSFDIIENSFNDDTGHGTAILGIICEHITALDAYVIKLQGINNKFTEELLCEGLYHALRVADVGIINISMGVITDAPSERLRSLCIEAYQKNIFIVASAYSNASKPCYPAYFENVFGVGKGYFMSEKFYQYIPDNKTNILAKGTHQKIATLNNAFTFSNGTSYAAAHFTGILYNILINIEALNSESILQEIKQNSTQPIIEVPLNYTKTEEVLSYETNSTQQFAFYSSVPNNVKKVALFPINCPEFKHIIKNQALFDKEIVLGIDFPGCTDNLDYTTISIVKQVPNSTELDLFDSVVISNITDGYGIDDFKLDMLTQFVVYDKNIITWNYPIYSIVRQIIAKEKHDYKGKIYFPYYSEDFMKEAYLNLSLPPSESIPSLPLISMEANTTGFGYQFVLSNTLAQKGYSVSNITIEPQGILFENIDIVFPYTSKRMVDLEWEKWGVFLRLAKRLIAYRKQPDIFISGIGHLLNQEIEEDASDNNNENDMLKNTIFLKGIKPDTYIGVINSTENLHHIKQSYTYVSNILGIEPLFFITEKPVNQHNRFIKIAHKKRYAVVNINDSKKIVKMIEKRFSN